jgi:hypothetical protein
MNRNKKRPSPILTPKQMKLMSAGAKMSDVIKGGPVTMSVKKKKPKRMNLGGEAATSVGRATVVKSQREAQRKKLDDMIQRLYGPSIKPKPKPKKPLKKVLGDKIKPRLKKKPLKKRLKGN